MGGAQRGQQRQSPRRRARPDRRPDRGRRRGTRGAAAASARGMRSSLPRSLPARQVITYISPVKKVMSISVDIATVRCYAYIDTTRILLADGNGLLHVLLLGRRSHRDSAQVRGACSSPAASPDKAVSTHVGTLQVPKLGRHRSPPAWPTWTTALSSSGASSRTACSCASPEPSPDGTFVRWWSRSRTSGPSPTWPSSIESARGRGRL